MYVLAKQLGKRDEAYAFNQRAENIRQAFNREFYDAKRKTYGTGSQCSLALPLYLKLVPEKDYQAVLQNLIKDIHQHGDRLTTGDVGNRYLFYTLAKNGYRELLYKMLNHYDHIENLLIPDLLGIQRNGDLIEIAPHPVGDLTWCKGSTMSAQGKVSVSWKIKKDKFIMDIDIPEGGFADVYMPYSDRAESIQGGHHHFEESVRR